jgi:hypothetical protein
MQTLHCIFGTDIWTLSYFHCLDCSTLSATRNGFLSARKADINKGFQHLVVVVVVVVVVVATQVKKSF